MKPGKPLTFGRRASTPVVGLPGNPISAMVTFEVFVRPGIRRMLGDNRPFRLVHDVVLTRAHRHSKGRLELARARVYREDGVLKAELHRLQGSGSLPSMVGIDALVFLPPETEELQAGERLAALLLRDDVGSAINPFD